MRREREEAVTPDVAGFARVFERIAANVERVIQGKSKVVRLALLTYRARSDDWMVTGAVR